ncbi:hypothetical protein HFP89_11705 [Wenzhouxiangella sp. XN79A]|uniref:hypothetical protein n=1 Tax=Wenzhouxiangella sp. XN79A TaxID=2724193 RepID=UPI00144ABDE0|nr:hypothetical protein [Wenzhouxiangella sp. XN79A]NKI35828.1 hypothetical protein [Wenzhouxiangella sp. XN79A]
MLRWVPLLILLTAALPAVATEYLVESRVWIDGELSGSPRLLVEADRAASIEVEQGDVAWRMSVVVEPPMAEEGAASDAIWVRVGISERIGEEWIFLTDSMLGVRRGATGSFSVVEPDIEIATPETARLFVEMTVTEAPADD